MEYDSAAREKHVSCPMVQDARLSAWSCRARPVVMATTSHVSQRLMLRGRMSYWNALYRTSAFGVVPRNYNSVQVGRSRAGRGTVVRGLVLPLWMSQPKPTRLPNCHGKQC